MHVLPIRLNTLWGSYVSFVTPDPKIEKLIAQHFGSGQVFKDLATKNRYPLVLVVSHGGLWRSLIKLLYFKKADRVMGVFSHHKMGRINAALCRKIFPHATYYTMDSGIQMST